MAASEMTMGIIFISQTSAGVLGNFCLLFQYLFLYITGSRLRSTDVIVMHLIVANFSTLLCKGVPQAMTALGMEVFLGDVGCKLLFYLHRVGRSVSMGTTCLLSVIQAITISPAGLSWAKLRAKALRYIGCSVNLTWALSILVNVMFPMHIFGKLSKANITHFTDFGYCLSVRHAKKFTILYATLESIPDVLGMALMLLSSSFMVLVLYRHTQKMSCVHRTNVSPRSYAYSRATKTILLLHGFERIITVSYLSKVIALGNESIEFRDFLYLESAFFAMPAHQKTPCPLQNTDLRPKPTHQPLDSGFKSKTGVTSAITAICNEKLF
uniref:vomeronasal type-1 receptor 4-like n=1 Tax=Jaculus jaculus TaxID=51337 RepID=UPI001E1B3B35|nr:vomeronasal type-1 receptor 4-like [Jaculus jaculus]